MLNRISLKSVALNWQILDCDKFPEINNIKLVSHEKFLDIPGLDIVHIEPGKILSLLIYSKLLFSFMYSFKVLLKANDKTVVLVNGGSKYLWLFFGIINSFPMIGKKKLICWDLFVECQGNKYGIICLIKNRITRFIIQQYSLNVLWSRKQIKTHSLQFNLPEDHFIFIPYKANHSKYETYSIPIDNFIFSGGNGKRDYKTLIEAVRGTNIPLVISSTDPDVRKKIEYYPNVIVVSAPEPAFAQLQAACRFVVIPMVYSGLKGGGEANFCNAMWHRKPVIAVDSMSASDYIIEGKTGYIVDSGDIEVLRKRIVELWGNVNLCRQMGLKGREHVEENFTHNKFIRRLLRLALLCGHEK